MFFTYIMLLLITCTSHLYGNFLNNWYCLLCFCYVLIIISWIICSIRWQPILYHLSQMTFLHNICRVFLVLWIDLYTCMFHWFKYDCICLSNSCVVANSQSKYEFWHIKLCLKCLPIKFVIGAKISMFATNIDILN